MASSRRIGVGIFVLLGFFLFGVGFFLIGNRQQLFQTSFTAYAEFSRLAGLQDGAKIQVSGLDAGEVDGIIIPPGPEAQFRVRMRIIEDVHPLVRQDSVATIQTEGLLGNKILVIGGGTEQSPPVPPGGTIPGQEPFELADLVSRGNEAFELLRDSLLDIKTDLEEAIRLTTETVQHADTLLENTGGDLEAMAASARAISADLETITAQVRAGEGTIGKLVYDDALYEQANAVADEVRQTMAEAQEAVASLRVVSERAQEMLSRFAEDGEAGGAATDIRVTLEAARRAMTSLAENMESLKRNWFFRGLFNERGFYDLDRVTVPEYRRGALKDAHPVTVRKWLSAEELFAENEAGEAVLTAEGRERIDKAVADLLRYPENQPLVIEGYAQEEERDAAYLVSHRRAMLVQDYLIGTYPLNPSYVTIMPMGAEPPADFGQGVPEEPSGVAMTLFLSRDLARSVPLLESNR